MLPLTQLMLRNSIFICSLHPSICQKLYVINHTSEFEMELVFKRTLWLEPYNAKLISNFDIFLCVCG